MPARTAPRTAQAQPESARFDPLEAPFDSRLVWLLPEGQMTISTRLTELLRVEHPIMLAPMDIVADGRLAATVTAAGGFGIIGGGYGNESWLPRELNAAGSARIGVGFITWSMARSPRLLDIALERKPAAIMLSFGDVKPHADKIKRAGALMICQIRRWSRRETRSRTARTFWSRKARRPAATATRAAPSHW